MTPEKAKRILAELARRHQNTPNWKDVCFDAQWNFINHPASFKAVQCTRRAGKSFSAGIYAYKEAYETPGCSVVILGLTRDSVKRIFFKDILKELDNRLDLDTKFNGSDLTATLPNGSIIYLLGVDANPDDMNKLLGQKNKLVVIDESAFFRQDMHKLIYEILRPSIIDYEGTVAMISTTSNLTNTLYYDVTNGKKSDWEVFQWTAYDNPHMAAKWKAEIAELKANSPDIVNTPHFRRMYMNEWHVDEGGLIYKYDKAVNDIEALPDDSWRYVLGIDLGYNDATAFVVCAYNQYDPKLYVLEAMAESNLIVSEVANRIKALQIRYPFETMVVDNASKQVVEELKQRYNLPLTAATKTDKRDFIELLNSDMLTGNIKVLPGANPLKVEWSQLVWDERALEKGKFVEHPSLPNHMCDAMLYAWRWCYQFSSKPRKQVVARGTEAEVDAIWEAEAQKLEQQKSLELEMEEDLFGLY
jgi:PBSX family phage terminase large subunit